MEIAELIAFVAPLVGALKALVGLAALVTVIVNVLKKFNVIPDGWGGFAALVGDLLLMVIGALAGYFEYDLGSVDAIAALVAQLLALALGSFLTHSLGCKMNWPLFGER